MADLAEGKRVPVDVLGPFVEAPRGSFAAVGMRDLGSISTPRLRTRKLRGGRASRELEALARILEAEAASARQEVDLMGEVVSTTRLSRQVTESVLTGEPLPPKPNPGESRPLALTPGQALAEAGRLGDLANRALQGLGEKVKARSDVIESAESKEREAKKPDGTDDTDEEENGTGGDPSDDEEEEEEERTDLDRGSGWRWAGETDWRQGGGDAEDKVEYWIPVFDESGEKSTIHLVLGRYGDKWYLARGIRRVETRIEDGTIIEGLAYDFNGPEVNKKELDAKLKEAKESEPCLTFAGAVSFLVSLIPIVGDVKDLLESMIGYDLITWEALSDEERALAFAGFLALGPISGAQLRLGTRAVDRATDLLRSGQKLPKELIEDLGRETLEKLQRSAAADGTLHSESFILKSSRVAEFLNARKVTRAQKERVMFEELDPIFERRAGSAGRVWDLRDPRGQGFDRYLNTHTGPVIVEGKVKKGFDGDWTRFRLPRTIRKGTQLSDEWTVKTAMEAIRRGLNEGNEELARRGTRALDDYVGGRARREIHVMNHAGEYYVLDDPNTVERVIKESYAPSVPPARERILEEIDRFHVDPSGYDSRRLTTPWEELLAEGD